MCGYIRISKLVFSIANLPNQAVAGLFTHVWNQPPIGHTATLTPTIKGKFYRPAYYRFALWCGWEGACFSAAGFSAHIFPIAPAQEKRVNESDCYRRYIRYSAPLPLYTFETLASVRGRCIRTLEHRLSVGVLGFFQEVLAQHLVGVPSHTAHPSTVRSNTSLRHQISLFGFLDSAPLGHVLVKTMHRVFAGCTGPPAKLALSTRYMNPSVFLVSVQSQIQNPHLSLHPPLSGLPPVAGSGSEQRIGPPPPWTCMTDLRMGPRS